MIKLITVQYIKDIALLQSRVGSICSTDNCKGGWSALVLPGIIVYVSFHLLKFHVFGNTGQIYQISVNTKQCIPFSEQHSANGGRLRANCTREYTICVTQMARIHRWKFWRSPAIAGYWCNIEYQHQENRNKSYADGVYS